MQATRLIGARTHNLKGVDLTLYPGQVVALTGVSGAGKSSLAMDTLYAEGQRRFVESFSPYARQFLERLERPPVKSLDPVPAGVAVDRTTSVKSSRSTLATMADLEAYFAALFLRESEPYCSEHEVAAVRLDADRAARRAIESVAGERAVLTYETPVSGVEQYLALREALVRDGYNRLWLEGSAEDLASVKPSRVLAAGKATVLLDRLTSSVERGRWASGIETAWQRSSGVAQVFFANDAARPALLLRQGYSCPVCQRPLSAPTPGQFRAESPLAACAACHGFGRVIGIDWDKVIPDPKRSLAEGAIRPWRGKSTTWERAELLKMCRRNTIDPRRPWAELSAAEQTIVLDGDGSWNKGFFPGVRGWFRWLETKTYKMHVRVFLARYRSYDPCPSCGGSRFNERTLSYRVAGLNLALWHGLEVDGALSRLEQLKTRTTQGEIARSELLSRLGYLSQVGLGYLTLNRQARTLSGGETQRVTLTAALGTSLHQAMFVLDEPTVGLHATDIPRLEQAIRRLADHDNVVVVVEHDPHLIAASDRVVELGKGAGRHGGEIVFDGTPAAAARQAGATKRALAAVNGRSGAARRDAAEPRQPTSWLELRRVSEHNLADIDVKIPLGTIAVVTGPSGSGKSTLVHDVLYRALARRLGDELERPGRYQELLGADAVKKVVLVDQSPLGRTSRGNAATYTKAWDVIRQRFAEEPLAKVRGYSASFFSFNVAGGRCETCAGEGSETVEMQFLADVRLICPACRGRRFSEPILEIRFRGRTIAEWLEGTVEQTLECCADIPHVLRTLGPVARLGLGYLTLGQPLSTLSGGEAQRLKLGRALGEVTPGTLVVVDEPSAGLHSDEVSLVLEALGNIVKSGGSVVAVEHDLHFIRQADWLIDLGPGGGAQGGRLVAEGTVAEVELARTPTGRALRGEVTPSPASPPSAGSAQRRRASTKEHSGVFIERAREHNLKEISVTIPHGALTVVTGPSGSGKSSLAFDVLFAEGQRRFMETLTPYARQFLPMMPRADVDRVTGVPPSIALEQRTARAGALSTVATVTEVAHYLRLLFAKVGVAHCPEHGLPIERTDRDRMLAAVSNQKGAFELLAPVVKARKGTYQDVFAAAARSGIREAYCDGVRVATDIPPKLAKTREHTIDLIIGRLGSGRELSAELLERALSWGRGELKLKRTSGEIIHQALAGACPVCQTSIPELDPRWFSFNTVQGRCPECLGRGEVIEVKPERKRRRKGRKKPKERSRKPVELAAGGGDAHHEAAEPCPACEGTRLSPIARSIRVAGQSYPEVARLSIAKALTVAESWRFDQATHAIWQPILAELDRRLKFLVDVGLDYLSLDRRAATLSGGEMQRLRLAAQLGAGLTGALYVLDEPTIGLHQADTHRLIDNLLSLVNLGSTVVVVEHDTEVISAAHHLLDLGPGGGAGGGEVIASDSPKRVLKNPASPTGRAMSKPPPLREPLAIAKGAPWLELSGVEYHNLKRADVRVPLGRLTVVAGVSGSGKSSLVREVLLPAVREALELTTRTPGKFKTLTGFSPLGRALSIDQSPIGRTPRSVPATFLGIWDFIRPLFARTTEAQIHGFGPGRFSFNAKGGGRCSACEGQGFITHEMSFLPDVVELCPACAGGRFEPETLTIKYRGLSIGEVLSLSAETAAEFFSHHPKIKAPLDTLTELGAGYIQLGQGSHTLSGGEAQRLKLAAELTAGTRHLPTLYVLDEPTTGLHLLDVERLMSVLSRLVQRGDTLLVIEHHPDVISGADWLIELGPKGGEAGGRVLFQGTPHELARRQTATAEVVRRRTAASRPKSRKRSDAPQAVARATS